MKGFTHESTYNESKEWYTPKEIFTAMGLHFDLDPCSPGKNIVSWIPADIHYTIQNDGLTLPWIGNVFMNPPYGSDTPKWFKRLAEHGQGIGLVFARTDTKWFHTYAPMANAICFINGRVQFIPGGKDKNNTLFADSYTAGIYQPKGGCGSASMLVAFGQKNVQTLLNSNLGLVYQQIK